MRVDLFLKVMLSDLQTACSAEVQLSEGWAAAESVTAVSVKGVHANPDNRSAAAFNAGSDSA